MRPVRLRSLLPILALAVLSAPALAEDVPSAPPAEVASKPDPEVALYISESLLPGEKETPEGWELLDEPHGAPSEDALLALGERLGLDDEAFYVQLQSYKKSGDVVTVAMLDVDEKVYALKASLAAKATAGGWHVSEMGHPGRILVLGGPTGAVDEMHGKIHEHVIYTLSELAMNRIRGRGGRTDEGRASAIKYTTYTEALAPGSGTAQAVVGCVHWLKSHPKPPEKKHDRKEQDKAIAHFTKALDADAFPPKGSVRVFVAGQMGGIILTWKDRSKLDAAIRALEIAVEHERDAKQQSQRYGNRYNLACAYARAKRIDDAFEMLESCLKMLKNMPVSAWRTHHKHADEKDEDMKPLREDPRFSELMSRYKPPEEKKRKLPKGHPPIK